ncbi:MAG TPA: 2OG-Fe(II) oxygenase family protein [Dongiaceae bacterium]|nr:2OG-Fe(II) oxygenase family protein [Dongiaceae bacterium]
MSTLTATASALKTAEGFRRYLPLIPLFERHGYAIIKLDAAVVDSLETVESQAKQFFGQSASIKHGFAAPSCVEGYREIGPEYSLVPERPDLTESFSFWYRNRRRPEIVAWRESCPLHALMHSTADMLSTVTADLFAAMAASWSSVGEQTPPLRFQEASYIQVNYYEPAQHGRDLLQDPHEDGHLITLVRSTEPGLEIKVGDTFQAIKLAPDEMLVMPGSLLTLMTGNLVPPLFHQVRNSLRRKARYSHMFFVNPELNQKLDPWIRNASNEQIDIIQHANSAPQQFGLPTLVEGAKGEGHSY